LETKPIIGSALLHKDIKVFVNGSSLQTLEARSQPVVLNP
jgi:hypothetical protein